jgi:hypothetical protein
MAIVEGATSGNKQEVDVHGNAQVKSAGFNEAGVEIGGGNKNGNAMLSENDDGSLTGDRMVLPPETDDDYRLRVALDSMSDDETFNYTAQNVKKHMVHNTTMTASFTATGLVLNGSNINTTNTGVRLQTYATFPFLSGGNRRIDQFEFSFSGACPSNTIVRFGSGLTPTTHPYAPTDGCYWELNAGGLQGYFNHNGSLVPSGVMPYTIVPYKVDKFMATMSNNKVTFWVNDVAVANQVIPDGQAQPFMSASLPIFVEQVITGGTAGGLFQAVCRGWSVSVGGSVFIQSIAEFGSSSYGDYQGLSGGTMGSLMGGTVTAGTVVPPTPAVPSNTANTNFVGLGGQFYETATLVAGVDAIIMSYQAPPATVNSLGKRLRIDGIGIASFIQTALTGGGYNAVFMIAKGATAVSMLTVDSANTKGAVRIMTPIVQAVPSGQAVNTLVAQTTYEFKLKNPVFVNAGEYFQILTKHIGTAPSAGVISHQISVDYTWV